MLSFNDVFQPQFQQTNHYEYNCYIAKYPRSTMVLFSKLTGTPLAGLIFKTSNEDVLSVLTARPPPTNATESYFQGIINKPDQVLDIIIVNLNNDGMINFNVLHTPHRVSEVDPGPCFGINKVNELHPLQVYTIPADQRTNKQIILSGQTVNIITTDNTVKTEKVLVEQNENKTVEGGVYFYLSVVASSLCPDLCAKFAEGTVWKCVNHFIKKTKQYKSLRQMKHQPVFENVEMKLGGNRRNYSRPAINATWDGSLNSNLDGGLGTVVGSYDNNESIYETSLPPDVAMTDVSSIPFKPIDIFKTQAGEIKYGENVVVNSSYTGEEYDYEHPSEPTVLCLSIYPELEFYPLPDLSQLADATLNNYIKNNNAELIASLKKIYKSDHCVIDLESPADTVILQCGHQCINEVNTKGLTKCPLCRSHITALIKM